jgi:pyruvate,orthophosphate dikinase
MAHEMNVPLGVIKMRVDDLHEFNPMMGHRGCRLGISYPEITEMQTRAILEAGLNMKAKGFDVKAEIMIPLVGTVREFNAQARSSARRQRLFLRNAVRQLDFLLGTMIETPRAPLIADSIGQQARVLLLRHQRPDADDHGFLARRRRQVPAELSERWHVRA